MIVDHPHTLIFQNNSGNEGDVCVYQEDPNFESLAWLTKHTFPTTKVRFTWKTSYSFVWSRTGPLEPGVIFMPSQNLPADMSATNQVTFTYRTNRYTFENQTAGEQRGRLVIIEDNALPDGKDASVGIGISGASAFAVQACPMITLSFEPKQEPKYWITFGTYSEGEVMEDASGVDPAEISFPAGVLCITATLDSSNRWAVAPGALETGESIRYGVANLPKTALQIDDQRTGGDHEQRRSIRPHF